MFRVLIAANIRLYREGLAQCLCQTGGFEVVHTAADVADAVAAVAALKPDVVLLDMATPGSHSAIPEIASVCPGTQVVALGVADSEGDVMACVEVGVAGYVPREGSLDDLVQAIESAARGELLCSPRLAGTLLRRLRALSAMVEPQNLLNHLTAREWQVAHLIGDGLSNKEIATRLGIEVATVKNHVHNMLEKLHVHRRSEATRRLNRVGVRS